MPRDLTTIALYLPQFHPIPENDEWWGRGFTEWRNTAKAKPLFRGHYQPHVPADLGFYDLRVPETRDAQAEMARAHGIDAFCYYHYWFGDGKRLLERPFEDVLASGKPDFPFCICWANESWTGIWHGAPNRRLVEQTYPGERDFDAHFEYLLRAFLDPRYLRIGGNPLLMIYRPREIPNVAKVIERWRNSAVRAGLPGLHLVGGKYLFEDWDPRDNGFDSVVSSFKRHHYGWATPFKRVRRFIERRLGQPMKYDVEDLLTDLASPVPRQDTHHPCLIPNWDNTPRSGRNGFVVTGTTPELFRVQIRNALARVESIDGGRRVLFIKSWNEWAEGNHMEPDLRDGRAWLEALRDEVAAWRAVQARHAAPTVGDPVVSGEQRRTT